MNFFMVRFLSLGMYGDQVLLRFLQKKNLISIDGQNKKVNLRAMSRIGKDVVSSENVLLSNPANRNPSVQMIPISRN